MSGITLTSESLSLVNYVLNQGWEEIPDSSTRHIAVLKKNDTIMVIMWDDLGVIFQVDVCGAFNSVQITDDVLDTVRRGVTNDEWKLGF